MKRLTMILISVLGMTTILRTEAPSEPQTKAESIWIGTELRLGMAKEAIMAHLTPSYKLVRISAGEDDWFVGDNGDPTVVYGSLGFTNGKLTYATKTWTPHERRDGFALAQAIHGALTEFAQEDKHVCYMDTVSKREPHTEHKQIWLSCGGKRLEISINEVFSGSIKGQYVDVREVLSSEKNR